MPIEDIEPGDLVAGIEENGGSLGFFPVERVIVTRDAEVLSLQLAGAEETLVVTATHPFWRAGDG